MLSRLYLSIIVVLLAGVIVFWGDNVLRGYLLAGQLNGWKEITTSAMAQTAAAKRKRVASIAVSPLTMFRGKPARSGRTTAIIPQHAPKFLWRYSTMRPIFSSPAIDARGNIYFGSLDKSIYSLTANGSLRWKRLLGGRIYSSPAVFNGQLFIGADNDRYFMLDAEEGEKIWSFALGPCPFGEGWGSDRIRCNADSSPIIGPNGLIYVGGDALYAFTSTGKTKWRFDLKGHAFSSPAIGPDGAVVIGFQGGGVVSVTSQGQKRWELSVKYDFDSTPAILGDSLVVIGSDEGRVYGLNYLDGKIQWSFRTRGPVVSSPAITADNHTILFGSDDQCLYAINTDGRLKWRFATGGPVRSSPLVDTQGTVVFGSQDNHLYALNSSGKLLWKIQLAGDIDSSVNIAPDGTLVVGDDAGYVYAFRGD